MHRLLTALATTAALLAVTACGESDQEQAREVAQAYVDASNEQDFEAVCELYSGAFKAQLGITDEACPEFVQENATGAETPQQLEFIGVRVREDVAFGDLNATGEDGQGPSRIVITLLLEDGEWRISGLQ